MNSFLRCRLLQKPLLGEPTTLASRSFHYSSYDYAKLVDDFARDRALRSGNVLHAHLVVNGLSVLSRIASRLAVFYIECGRATDAHQVFDNIQERNVGHWIVYIGALVTCGFYTDAFGHFLQMQREGLRPDKFVFPSLLKACGHLHDVRTGEGLHGLTLKCSLHGDAFVDCGLIDMYAKCGCVGKAGKVFDAAEEMDLAMLNAMVSGYAQNGYPQEAFELVGNAKSIGLKPDIVTWNAVISGFSKSGDFAFVKEIFELMKSHRTEPDVVSWTSVISGCVQNFQTGDAFQLFKEMLGEGTQPNSATISSLLPACASIANAQCGKELHGHAVVTGVESDIFVMSALIDMYAKCGFMSEASWLFNKMSEKNTVSWNSMIFGLGSHGYCTEAINTFSLMEKEAGKMIDHLTFTAALTACSHGGKTELGESLFKKMQETYSIAPRLEHYACMVDLLGRAGKLQQACDFIKGMPMEPNLFVWGALLGACRRHGDIELARIAAWHLSRLEPENGANNLLLSGIYADAGTWEVAERMKRKSKRKGGANRVRGCSWVEAK